jgi:hypothetical protein
MDHGEVDLLEAMPFIQKALDEQCLLLGLYAPVRVELVAALDPRLTDSSIMQAARQIAQQANNED